MLGKKKKPKTSKMDNHPVKEHASTNQLSTHEKAFTISCHQQNSNYNHHEKLLYSHQDG